MVISSGGILTHGLTDPSATVGRATGALSWPKGVQFWQFPVEGGGVVARSDVKGLFLLNPSAFAIWLLLRSGDAPGLAASRLGAAFGISRDVARRDIELAMDTWQCGLLTPAVRPLSSQLPITPALDCNIRVDCVLHGKSFRLLLSSRDLEDEIAPRLDALRVGRLDSPDVTIHLIQSGEFVYLIRDGAIISRVDDPAEARIMILLEMVRLAGSERDFLAILHAGACGFQSHGAIFAGATHSGKTTLAAILMASGLTLYADDSVALHRRTLQIPAMPFGLMVREGSWPVVSRHFADLEALPTYDRYNEKVKFLPNRADPNSLTRASTIVFSRWQSTGPTAVQRITTFQALLQLKQGGFWVAHDRVSIQQFLQWLAGLSCYELIYSDVTEAAKYIKRLLN